MIKPQIVIGRADRVDFPRLGVSKVPARVDTGAKTSAIWATNIREKDGHLEYSLFGKGSHFYTGEIIRTSTYGQLLVASSTGHVERRYSVKMIIILADRRIKATFTLADRSTQVYPILVGRNILRGKFIVNVKLGKPLTTKEKLREVQKRKTVDK